MTFKYDRFINYHEVLTRFSRESNPSFSNLVAQHIKAYRSYFNYPTFLPQILHVEFIKTTIFVIVIPPIYP